MSSETLLIARVAFWLLAALVVLLPVRWSTLAFLLLVQFDLSGTATYTAESLGIENAIKVTLIPTILLWRMKEEISFDSRFAKLRHIWLFFAGYACLAILWSPFKLPALKMLGYFYAYCVLFIVFTIAWRKGWFNARSLMIVLWLSLLFAFVQTYGLGNEYGSVGNFYGSIDYEFRFTSFTGAQSFAAFLLSLFVLLVFCEEWNFAIFAAAAGATTGLILTGSRSIFLGFCWILLLAGVIFAKRKGKKLSLGVVAKRMTVGAVVLLVVGTVVLSALPENRLNQMLSASVSSDQTLEDVGTFVWRFSLYQKTIEELPPLPLRVGPSRPSPSLAFPRRGCPHLRPPNPRNGQQGSLGIPRHSCAAPHQPDGRKFLGRIRFPWRRRLRSGADFHAGQKRPAAQTPAGARLRPVSKTLDCHRRMAAAVNGIRENLMVSKTLHLLSLLHRNPREFYERIASSIGSRWQAAGTTPPSYRVCFPERGLSQLSEVLNADISSILHDPELDMLSSLVEGRATASPPPMSFAHCSTTSAATCTASTFRPSEKTATPLSAASFLQNFSTAGPCIAAAPDACSLHS